MALLALTLALLAMTVATTDYEVKPLDMALDSFDDQYQNCSHAMVEELPGLEPLELQNRSLLSGIWDRAAVMWRLLGSHLSPLSYPAQAIATMVYTVDDVSEQFDNNVSVAGRSPREYRDNFHFKILHFVLTDALAALRDARKEQECLCVLWGVDKYKFEANVGDVVRLGRFVSSRLCTNVINGLRATTVFKARTCHGADIREFSNSPTVKEVLIPPFEKFNITEVKETGTSVEIHLDSMGTYSKYNCEWLTGGSVPTTPLPTAASEGSSWSPQPSQWLQSSSGSPQPSQSSSGPPQPSQWLQSSSEPPSHQGHQDLCSHCGSHDHQNHQDSQRNKATKTAKATTASAAILAAMASMWSLRPPLAL